MDPYLTFLRPVLFRMSADRAHRLAHLALRWSWPWRLIGSGPEIDPRLAVEVHGLRLANPVGLAPGFDKDCELLQSLMHLGFGFLAPGAIMRQVRAGNPRPRLGRIVEQEAVLNCLGLPSKGWQYSVARLQRLTWHRALIFADVQGESPQEILDNVEAIQPYAEALEVSLVCPNTHDSDANFTRSVAVELLPEIARRRIRPVFVKVPQLQLDAAGVSFVEFLDTCVAAGIEGIIITGSWYHKTPQLSRGIANLTGKPIFQNTLRMVREASEHTGGRLSIIGSGGVWTGRDVYEMFRAGASLVEFLSAMIYRGPMAPALINRELVAVLEAEGVASVQVLVDGARKVRTR
ncbi:MAG: dihydroorotate dehydrogenase 2 [Chloroflexi bacterium]|nr:dihydroorotate dehydrogenase 2 [Chloroflexota bacterium]